MLQGEDLAQTLIALVAFLSGCLVGLVSCSKLLKVLLRNWRDATLAVLCCVMGGSLRKLWPFKKDLTPDEVDLALKRFANTWPDQWNTQVWLTVGLAVGGLLLVLGLGMIGSRAGNG